MLRDDKAMPYIADMVDVMFRTGCGVAPCAALCGK
jgi:hypothetical protein